MADRPPPRIVPAPRPDHVIDRSNELALRRANTAVDKAASALETAPRAMFLSWLLGFVMGIVATIGTLVSIGVFW